MSLRTRLVLAFFALSVLPLGAVMVFTYLRNVDTMRQAAAREAELLASELTRSTRVLTTQLGQRFERLMPGAGDGEGRVPVPRPMPSPPIGNDAIAAALGESAILLNNLEVRDLRPFGRGGRGRGESAAAQQPPGPQPDEGRLLIDLAPVRREMLRQLVPNRETFDQLSPDERARIFETVNERMLDVRQGIQIVQSQVARQAAGGEGPASAGRDVPAALPTQRRTALTGSRLDVSLERGGTVIGQVNAEVNLSRLLATVFTMTPRRPGDVPFAVDSGGQLYTRGERDAASLEQLGITSHPAEVPVGTRVLERWVVVTTDGPSESGLRFGIARPLGPELDDLRRATAGTLGFGLLLIGLALAGIVPLSSGLTRSLGRLSEGVRRIADGDYAARVEVRSHDEIGALGQAFNTMAADVERHQQALVHRERLRRELELGRQIQDDMLPRLPLRAGQVEARGVSVPALEVGGDFYSYFLTRQGKLALLVGDVSGKGVGAALLMAKLQAALRTRLDLGQDLSTIAADLDREIEASTPGPVYATLLVGLLDLKTCRLDYVNAGHPPLIVQRLERPLERLGATGLPIGLLAGQGYQAEHLQLRPGDRLFFFTDGCVEAENPGREPFGTARLEAALAVLAASSTEEVLNGVSAAVDAFRSGAERRDDATMMIVRIG